jgi:hypothetical protein
MHTLVNLLSKRGTQSYNTPSASKERRVVDRLTLGWYRKHDETAESWCRLEEGIDFVSVSKAGNVLYHAM